MKKTKSQQGNTYRKERFTTDAAFQKPNAYETTTVFENALWSGPLLNPMQSATE